MRPIVVFALLAVLLASTASAAFIASFTQLDSSFYQGEAGRVALNSSCWGYSSEFIEGDLIRYAVLQDSTVLKQSFFLYVEPCSEVAHQVFLLNFASNTTTTNLTIKFSRADYPLNYWTSIFSQNFAVLPRPVAVNNSNESLSGELLTSSTPLNSFKFPKPDWIIWVALALGLIATIFLFFFRSLKWSLIFLFLMSVTGAYYILA